MIDWPPDVKNPAYRPLESDGRLRSGNCYCSRRNALRSWGPVSRAYNAGSPTTACPRIQQRTYPRYRWACRQGRRGSSRMHALGASETAYQALRVPQQNAIVYASGVVWGMSAYSKRQAPRRLVQRWIQTDLYSFGSMSKGPTDAS